MTPLPDTVDGALGGAVRVVQPARGYRYSLDAVLLARFAAERPASSALDLGCGCGVVGLCLLALGGARSVTGVDLVAAMVARARRGAERNGWQDRCRFLHGDLRDPDLPERIGRFPLVVANPPYRAVGAGRLSPDPDVAVARHEVACTPADLAGAASRLLEPGGSVCVVYPSERWPVLKAALAGQGLSPAVVWPVRPRPEGPDRLVLVRCRFGNRGTPEVRPALVLHAPGCRYSPAAERLLGPP